MHYPTLNSERLVLRPPHPEDARPIEQYVSATSVNGCLIERPHPFPKGGALNWIEAQAKGVAGLNLAITHDNTFVGVIGIKASSEKTLGVFAPTIGYWLAPPFWGKGFMQEAARRLLDWYMPHEPTEKMCAAAFEDNERSLSVLSKLGFREVDRNLAFSPARGHEVPQIKMELTAERYREHGAFH
ncbi:GNAT family N-acetyltransferase [Cohaesibacter celericrescens]|uniref:N-acetyltransferase domain-containing protein n=1 Tax=Cohaesibacter celericrescens TaxID=2067669 RepID=A0A2N5XPH1_9HYPH|nr:GNAT family N-acetyltransferase [Cohaesibacter celericrescens]PLW76419.1 hypothetical protein C0081_16205 [Cohaesibacter celericrescens]